MRYLTILFAFLVMLMCAGCETQNPICNDLWCVEGNVYPRSELDDAIFDEVNVETGDVLGVLGNTTPAETANIIPIAHIVSDTLAGNTNYENKIVSVNATVEFNFTPDLATLTLETSTDTASFIVRSPDAADRISVFQKGMTYDFTLFVSTQGFRTSENRHEVYAYPIGTPQAESITLDALISDVKQGNKTYQANLVNLTAQVVRNGTNIVSLNTNDAGVDIYIRKTGNGYEDGYKAGDSYDFPIYVERIDADDLTDIVIWTLLVVE